MLVKVLNFGSNWWSRFGRDSEDRDRFTRHAAYYNSTGVHCGSKIRRYWTTAGLLRFNAVGDFHPSLSDRAVGRTFICADLTSAFGGNRLLFRSMAAKLAVPDWYLVVISSEAHGRIDFTSCVWKSVLSRAIAASQLREIQETMLLMKPGDWIQTNSGFWQLNQPRSIHERPRLVRIGEPISIFS